MIYFNSKQKIPKDNSHSHYNMVEKNVENVFGKYLKENTIISIYDAHQNWDYYKSPKEIDKKFFERTAKYDYSLIIVNWGWSSTKEPMDCIRKKIFGCFTGIRANDEDYNDYLIYEDENDVGKRHGHLCNDEVIIPLDFKNTEDTRFIIAPKANSPIGSLVRLEEGNRYVLYLFYDSIHGGYIEELEVLKQIINIASIQNQDFNIFKPMKIEDETEKNKPKKEFKSISAKYSEVLAEQNLNVDDLIKEMISKVDIDRLTKIINIGLIQNNKTNPNEGIANLTQKCTKKYLENWAKAKMPIYLMLGRQLKISETVKTQKDPTLFKEQVTSLMSKYPQYYLNVMIFEDEEIYDNKAGRSSNRYIDERVIDGLLQEAPLKAGMKVTKWLSSIIKDNDFNMEFSNLYQDKNIDLVLSLSIDPYDYLTSSINKAGWRSCHNFFDGDKRAASLSYMFDETSLVAYACKDEEKLYIYPKYKFKGNSKQWRQMVFLDCNENRFICSREYPQEYFNKIFTKNIRTMLEDKISEFCDIDNLWICYYNAETRGESYMYKNSLAYDDICSRDTVTVKHKANIDCKNILKIGSDVICPICQKKYLLTNRNLITCASHSGFVNAEKLTFPDNLEDIINKKEYKIEDVADLVGKITQEEQHEFDEFYDNPLEI